MSLTPPRLAIDAPPPAEGLLPAKDEGPSDLRRPLEPAPEDAETDTLAADRCRVAGAADEGTIFAADAEGFRALPATPAPARPDGALRGVAGLLLLAAEAACGLGLGKLERLESLSPDDTDSSAG